MRSGRKAKGALGAYPFLRDGRGELVTGVVDLAVSADHTCAIFTDGKLRCWGDNLGGQCGTAPGQSTVAAPTPVRDASGAELVGVRQVVAADGYTCAVLQDGTPLCWGVNIYGQPGNGLYYDMPHVVPDPVDGLGDGLDGGPGGGGGTVGLWDPARRQTESWIRLLLSYTCPDWYSNSFGHAEYDIELAPGKVLRAYRECTNLKYASFFYEVRTTGTGEFVCQP